MIKRNNFLKFFLLTFIVPVIFGCKDNNNPGPGPANAVTPNYCANAFSDLSPYSIKATRGSIFQGFDAQYTWVIVDFQPEPPYTGPKLIVGVASVSSNPDDQELGFAIRDNELSSKLSAASAISPLCYQQNYRTVAGEIETDFSEKIFAIEFFNNWETASGNQVQMTLFSDGSNLKMRIEDIQIHRETGPEVDKTSIEANVPARLPFLIFQ